jgi:PKD repeat protein
MSLPRVYCQGTFDLSNQTNKKTLKVMKNSILTLITATVLTTGSLFGQFQVTTQSESCSGMNDGKAMVHSFVPSPWKLVISSGVSPISFIVVSQDTSITGLTPGVYTFSYSQWSPTTDSLISPSDTTFNILGGTQINPSFTHTSAPLVTGYTEEVAFTNTTGTTYTYLWDFGDGQSETSLSPVHAYSATGEYNVMLKAYNSIGCSSVTFEMISVTIAGPALMDPNNTPVTSREVATSQKMISQVANPQGEINVLVNSDLASVVRVLNVNGMLVQEINVNQENINVQIQTPGIYLIQVISHEGTMETRKIFAQ